MLSIAFKMVLRQFWWKVFGKAILENKFLSKACQFRNKKETREFKHLRFYKSNNLSPELTKNQIISDYPVRQREVFKVLREVAEETNSQIIVASHSEVVLNEAVATSNVIVLI